MCKKNPDISNLNLSIAQDIHVVKKQPKLLKKVSFELLVEQNFMFYIQILFIIYKWPVKFHEKIAISPSENLIVYGLSLINNPEYRIYTFDKMLTKILNDLVAKFLTMQA